MAAQQTEAAQDRRSYLRRRVGLIIGPLFAVTTYLLMNSAADHGPALTAAIAVLMATWWMTEAIPIPATALLPLLLFPLFSDTSVSEVGAHYGSSVIFLFMGGFLLALAVQRWQLHRRLAVMAMRYAGDRPVRVIAAFMAITAALSMWVSNTATAVMMLPIGVSVLVVVLGTSDPEKLRHSNFAMALILGIAYAASTGSIGTIIGTPPNTLLVGYLDDTFGITIGFGQWMLVGVPLAIVLTIAAWLVLTRIVFRPEFDRMPSAPQVMRTESSQMGPWTTAQKRTLFIFVLAVVSWIGVPVIFRGNPPISDAGIAIGVAVILFMTPAGNSSRDRLLDWETAKSLPWGVLLLFGGGLALSSQFVSSGLTEVIGQSATGLAGVPLVLVILLIAGGVILLTEMTSNTATAATLLPVAGGLAVGLNLNPIALTVPVALAASCAFMLPVATPPNAIAYGTGHVSIGHMMRGGWMLNVLGVLAITLVTMTLVTWVFGIALSP